MMEMKYTFWFKKKKWEYPLLITATWETPCIEELCFADLIIFSGNDIPVNAIIENVIPLKMFDKYF